MKPRQPWPVLCGENKRLFSPVCVGAPLPFHLSSLQMFVVGLTLSNSVLFPLAFKPNFIMVTSTNLVPRDGFVLVNSVWNKSGFETNDVSFYHRLHPATVARSYFMSWIHFSVLFDVRLKFGFLLWPIYRRNGPLLFTFGVTHRQHLPSINCSSLPHQQAILPAEEPSDLMELSGSITLLVHLPLTQRTLLFTALLLFTFLILGPPTLCSLLLISMISPCFFSPSFPFIYTA